MEVLNVKDATFSYGKKLVFEKINFSIREGEIFCLLGPNGTGKSTLLSCVIGLQRLAAGMIKINNKPITKLKPSEIAQNIAFVPQLHSFTFPFDVIDLVLMGRASQTKFYSAPSKEDRLIAEEALCTLGMIEFKNRKITELSGGERQLVMIARALAQKTPIIVMDEPTAHLDLNHELHILETIKYLVKTLNISIVMATHFPNHSFYFSDGKITTNVALLKNHQFMYSGEAVEVLNEQTIKDVFEIKAKIQQFENKNMVHSYILPLNTISEDEHENN